jgi:Trypsin
MKFCSPTDQYSYEPASDNEQFPWFCMVYKNEDWKPICYCTIVRAYSIVTASECFRKEGLGTDDPKKYHIRYGSIAASSVRKITNIEKIIQDQDNQKLVILKPEPLIDGNGLIELDLETNNNIIIATMHSHKTRNPMKTHVHLVKSKVCLDPEISQFS